MNGLELLTLLMSLVVITICFRALDIPGYVILTLVLCFAFLYFLVTGAPR